jgi:hypothetical protein
MKLRILSLAGLALAAGCAATANPSDLQPELASISSSPQTPPNYPSNYPPPMTSLSQQPPPPPRDFSPPPPPPMQGAAQGWFGIGYVDTRNVDLSSGSSVSDIDVDSANMPVIGGAFLKPLTGNRFQLGLEGGLNMGWLGNVNAVAVGGGGAAVAVDTDVFLFELFAGPYVSWLMTPKARLYLATGFALDWASFDYDIGASHIYDDGFGDGYYVRTGIEVLVGPGSWVGFGVRRVDTAIDPGGNIDEVDLRQTQYLLTVTHSM